MKSGIMWFCGFRPVFEGCFSEEPLPYSDPTGAAGGGNCRLDSPNQESRIQRTRGQDSRGHGHTPQNRPHGNQPPDLPEGYGQSQLRYYAFPVHLLSARVYKSFHYHVPPPPKQSRERQCRDRCTSSTRRQVSAPGTTPGYPGMSTRSICPVQTLTWDLLSLM